MDRIAFVLLMITLFSCQSVEKEVKRIPPKNLRDSLTVKLNAIHEKGYINGFGVAIVNENGLLYTNGFGVADVEKEISYTKNSVQNIGSVSKTLIGLSLLKAQELGMLNLDDPISKYLPFEVVNPNFEDQPITLRHLATHTSSILDTDLFDEKCYVLEEDLVLPDSIIEMSEVFNPPSAKIEVIDFLEKILTKEGEWYDEDGFLEYKPGEKFEYSNLGSTLAAAVLEIAAKTSFSRFSTEHILEPLNMSSSAWEFKDIDLAKHSKVYIKPELELPLYSLITYPDGGLLTTSTDMAKFLSELIKGYLGKGEILSADSYKEYYHEYLSEDQFLEERDEDFEYDEEYNSGIFMGFTHAGFIGHTGGDPGVASFMFFKPEEKTGKYLMINTSVRGSEEAVAEFFDIWYTLNEYEEKLNQSVNL